MQIFDMALKNALYSKAKLIMISLFISIGMVIFTLTIGVSTVSLEQVSKSLDNLEQNNEMRVTPRMSGGSISKDTIVKVEETGGVSSVLLQYNVFGLLEKKAQEPIYNVSMNGFDFEKSILVGADDYRGKNINGILLPDLVVELNGRIVLADLVGEKVYFTYEYLENNQVNSDTIECEVIGTYDTVGVIEENPVYMSWDLFYEILDKKGVKDSGVDYLIVYAENSEVMGKLSEEIESMGLIVSYESVKQDYINFLTGFRTIGLIIGLIVFILATIIIVQTVTNNVRRREKAIGVMKVCGYSNTKISKLILYELLIYCIIGLVLAFAILSIFDTKVSNIFSPIMFGAKYRFKPQDGLINAIICVIICGISTIKPVIRCIRLNPIEVLKGE